MQQCAGKRPPRIFGVCGGTITLIKQCPLDLPTRMVVSPTSSR
jgi:hypothetical protein